MCALVTGVQTCALPISVFAEIHPDWYHRPSADGHEAEPFDDALLRQARDSALGRRMLARWLLRDIGGELLAPRPDEIGRASCRERVCQDGSISGVAV